MKKRLIIFVLAAIMIFGSVAVISAQGLKTPADVYSGLTGKTTEEAWQMRQSGKRFGQLADEEGVLEDFRQKMLENKKALIQDKVDKGLLTDEQADEIIKNMEDNMMNCDGTGRRLGQASGLRLGAGQKDCEQGPGIGKDRGNGAGRRAGKKLRNGAGRRAGENSGNGICR